MSVTGTTASRVRRAGVVLLVVVLLAGVVAANRLTPDADRRMAPLPTAGRIGRPVDTGGFVVTVEKVQVTRKLVVDDGFGRGSTRTSDGLWVVLTATLTGDWKASSHGQTRLEGRGGRSYHVSERIESSRRLTEDFLTEPGIPRSGQIVFEIPPDELAGSLVRIGRSESGGRRLVPEAVVDLGLDDAAARRLVRAAPRKVALTQVEYGR